MTKSDKIRALAGEGLGVADIARELGIRYQHAYGVLNRCGMLPGKANGGARTTAKTALKPQARKKPELSTATLLSGGFAKSAHWVLSEAGDLVLDRALPKESAVYAFAKEGKVLYIGVATMGLAKRLYFYGKPGVTQRTSQRLNGILKAELQAAPYIEIYAAFPPDLQWNGLPVHGCAGLELGLIKKFDLPWNKRSSG